MMEAFNAHVHVPMLELAAGRPRPAHLGDLGIDLCEMAITFSRPRVWACWLPKAGAFRPI